jgi:hypothetical protein
MAGGPRDRVGFAIASFLVALWSRHVIRRRKDIVRVLKGAFMSPGDLTAPFSTPRLS